jgi:hypothetical protein
MQHAGMISSLNGSVIIHDTKDVNPKIILIAAYTCLKLVIDFWKVDEKNWVWLDRIECPFPDTFYNENDPFMVNGSL